MVDGDVAVPPIESEPGAIIQDRAAMIGPVSVERGGALPIGISIRAPPPPTKAILPPRPGAHKAS